MGAGGCAGELPQKYKMAITFVSMSICVTAGFFVQQRLIRQRYSDAELDLYVRVKEIRDQEMQAIAAKRDQELQAIAANSNSQRQR